MKRDIFFGLLLVLLLLLPQGCKMMEGTGPSARGDDRAMLNQDTLVGMPAPFISYTDEIGRTRPLSNSYGDATLIALVDENDPERSSKISRLSREVAADVTVIEICLGGKDKAMEAIASKDKAMEATKPILENKTSMARNIITLSDKKGLIPTRFNNAAVDSLFLLDRNGVIRREGRISQLQSFKKEISDMKERREKENEELYSGG